MKFCFRRITLAAALALIPALAWSGDETAAKAKFGEWLHDEIQPRALWLHSTPNLAIERAPANLPPRKAGKRWVLSRDAASGAVVYFVPGDIRTVEIDTHRLVGTEGDLSLSVSPDGKIWIPLLSTVATLEVTGEWEYRLLAVDTVPAGMTHLRVEFPESTKPPALRLTEVWIRFDWEDTLLNPDAPAAEAMKEKSAAPADAKAAVKESPQPDHSLALAATKTDSAPQSAPVIALKESAAKAEPEVRSVALFIPKAETPATLPEIPQVIHQPAPEPTVVVPEVPRVIPMAPIPAAQEVVAASVVAEPAADFAVSSSATPSPASAPAAVSQPTVVSAPITNSPGVVAAETRVTEAETPAVAETPAKKFVKKSTVSRVRRGPRSK